MLNIITRFFVRDGAFIGFGVFKRDIASAEFDVIGESWSSQFGRCFIGFDIKNARAVLFNIRDGNVDVLDEIVGVLPLSPYIGFFNEYLYSSKQNSMFSVSIPEDGVNLFYFTNGVVLAIPPVWDLLKEVSLANNNDIQDIVGVYKEAGVYVGLMVLEYPPPARLAPAISLGVLENPLGGAFRLALDFGVKNESVDYAWLDELYFGGVGSFLVKNDYGTLRVVLASPLGITPFDYFGGGSIGIETISYGDDLYALIVRNGSILLPIIDVGEIIYSIIYNKPIKVKKMVSLPRVINPKDVFNVEVYEVELDGEIVAFPDIVSFRVVSNDVLAYSISGDSYDKTSIFSTHKLVIDDVKFREFIVPIKSVYMYTYGRDMFPVMKPNIILEKGDIQMNSFYKNFLKYRGILRRFAGYAFNLSMPLIACKLFYGIEQLLRENGFEEFATTSCAMDINNAIGVGSDRLSAIRQKLELRAKVGNIYPLTTMSFWFSGKPIYSDYINLYSIDWGVVKFRRGGVSTDGVKGVKSVYKTTARVSFSYDGLIVSDGGNS